MSVYIKATNTGEGFITVADRQEFNISNLVDDIWEVSGNYQAWVTRVNGVELSSEESSARLHNLSVFAQIKAIEDTITNRRIREAALTPEGKAWLEQTDAAITALRITLIS
jgi:hypothetical protein